MGDTSPWTSEREVRECRDKVVTDGSLRRVPVDFYLGRVGQKDGEPWRTPYRDGRKADVVVAGVVDLITDPVTFHASTTYLLDQFTF